MTRFYVLVLTLTTSLAIACAPASAEVDLAAEEAAIRQLTMDWFAAEARRDMEASLSYVAPDVVIQPEGAPTITGVTAMRTLYEEVFGIPYTDFVSGPRTIVVAESGDLAYDMGGFKMIFEGPDGKTEAPGKGIIIWRKIEGEWKAVVLSFSMDAPPAGAES